MVLYFLTLFYVSYTLDVDLDSDELDFQYVVVWRCGGVEFAGGGLFGLVLEA